MSYMMIFPVYNYCNKAFCRYIPNLSRIYLPVLVLSCSYLPNQSGIYLPDVVYNGKFGILRRLKKKCSIFKCIHKGPINFGLTFLQSCPF